MSLFGSPAPQWIESSSAALALVRPVFFLDEDGDWAVTSDGLEGSSVTGVVFLDADDEVALDVTLPEGAEALKAAMNPATNEVTVY